MLDDIKKTIKQSAVYGLSRVSSKLTGFVLIPLYAACFTTDVYGVLVRLELMWQFLLIIFTFGFETGIVRWLTEIKDDIKKKQFLFSACLFLLVFDTILIALIFFFSNSVSSVILGDSGYHYIVFLTSIIAVLETFVFIVFLKIRIDERPLKYTLYSILITLINLFLQVYFILYTDNKLEGIFIAKIIAPLVVFFILIPEFLKSLHPGFDFNLLKSLIKFSFPVMSGNFIWMLIVHLDKYTLGFLASSSDVGVYGLAASVCGVINFVITFPFQLAFTVYSWKKLNDENAKRFFTKSITYLFYSVIYLGLALSVFAPYILELFISNPDYLIAVNFIPILVLSLPFWAINTIGLFSFQVTKKTKYQFLVYFISLVLSVILYLILIPLLRGFGAAFTNVLVFTVLNILIYLYSKRNYFFEYEWLKIFEMSFLYIVLTAPFYFLNIKPLALDIILRIIVVMSYPFILYVFKFYEKIELQTIKKLFNNYIQKKKIV